MIAPRWARVLAVVSVVLVALVAAIASYSHMRALAVRAGEGWRSVLLPLSVDGMLVAASLVLLVRRRSGLPGSVLAWLALVLGLAVSLVANVAAAQPTLVGRLVAAWPPLAFGIAYELLLCLVRPVRSEIRADAPMCEVEPVSAPAPVPAVPVEVEPVEPVQIVEHQDADDVRQAGDDERQPLTSPPGDDLVSLARDLVNAGEAEGRRVGRARLADELGISEHRARQVLDQLADEQRPTLQAVGGDPR